ncbi:hypothetical protein HPB51_025044 [Rhipicephalus microplus]|uniref:Uncharacterized protein n=1 Tax=Rhipicephalus microplus TaxID=6941 RepID=A0A9J6EVT1_RHIMP|nr:hypothetical protein HPB51_025044 [Rhipicephalus microplus]
MFFDEEEKAVRGHRQLLPACVPSCSLHRHGPRLPFATPILRSTVVLELRVLVLVAKSFHNARLRNLAVSIPTRPNPSPGLHGSLDLQDRDLRAVAAPTCHKARRTKSHLNSSFSDCFTISRGPDTSPLASPTWMQADIPEHCALTTMHQKAGKGKPASDDSEDRIKPSWIKPSVGRRRGGPPTMTTSKRTLGEKCAISAAPPSSGISIGPSGCEVFGGVTLEVVAGRGTYLF